MKVDEVSINNLQEAALSTVTGIRYSIENYDSESIKQLIEILVDTHKKEKRIVVSGKGNSGSVGQFFVRRCLHLGYNISFIEDAGCPALKKGDIAFFVSGSGTTSGVVNQSKIAKELGAIVILITSENSNNNNQGEKHEYSVRDCAELIVEVGGKTKEQRSQTIREFGSRQIAGTSAKHVHKTGGILILGTQFELNALVFLMSLTHSLMPHIGITEEKAWERHKKME
jgi:6-phospho-3-hexuloisomerase